MERELYPGEKNILFCLLCEFEVFFGFDWLHGIGFLFCLWDCPAL